MVHGIEKRKDGLLYDLIMAYTRRKRALMVSKYIRDEKDKTLLDVGCGDRYFIERFHNTKCVGEDLRSGNDADDGLRHDDDVFDYVTMLAVAEHLKRPSYVFSEVRRVLKDGGLFVLTTPKKQVDKLINTYLDHSGHLMYLDRDYFSNIKGFRVNYYGTFELGCNQIVVLESTKGEKE